MELPINILYNLEAIIPKSKKEYIQRNNYGEFSVYKEFSVNSSQIKKESIFGYVIQKISKKTKVVYFEEDEEKIINTTDEIMDFTSNQVNYSKKNYYELFFLMNGASIFGDTFQNGAILHYNIEDKNDIYADDEVPTAGIIEMIGESYFVEDKKENVIENSKKENPIIFDIKWNTNDNLPSNGLPYAEDVPENLLNKRNSNVLVHTVNVKWDGIKDKQLKIFKNLNNSNKTYKNNNSISNIFKKLNISNNKKSKKHKKMFNKKSNVTSTFS